MNSLPHADRLIINFLSAAAILSAVAALSTTAIAKQDASQATLSVSLPNTVQELRNDLDAINFNVEDKKERVALLKERLDHVEALADTNSKDAGYQMMAGFYNIQYAGNTGGIGALKYAKKARKYLDKSVALDPSLFGAAAHAVLGTIYAQVPGWPIGFGDKKKSEKNYQAALKISPDGLNSNFSYAQHLFGQKKYQESKAYLEKAKIAPAREGRPIANAKLPEILNKLEHAIEEKLSEEN